MKTIQWKKKYNIGDETIDSQHQEIVAMLEYLQESRETCLDPAETDKLFDKLEAYAENHFAYEESLMQNIDYPFLNSHKKDHDFFRKTTKQWRNDETIDCKSEKISIFLTEWLLEHILHYDMKIKEYLPDTDDTAHTQEK